MAAVEIKWSPSRNELKLFGFLALTGFAMLGAFIAWQQAFLFFDLGPNARVTALVLCGIGIVSATFSLIRPGANRPLWVVMMVVAWPIGMAVSYVLMAVVFYGVFTPIGIMFRLIGRDPLCRGIERGAKSYWTPHEPVTDVKRYFRQF
jgi:hypothetical protein